MDWRTVKLILFVVNKELGEIEAFVLESFERFFVYYGESVSSFPSQFELDTFHLAPLITEKISKVLDGPLSSPFGS